MARKFEILVEGTRVVEVKYLGDPNINPANDMFMDTWVLPTTAPDGMYMEPPVSWTPGRSHCYPFWERQIAAFEANPLFEVTGVTEDA